MGLFCYARHLDTQELVDGIFSKSIPPHEFPLSCIYVKSQGVQKDTENAADI